MRAYHLARLHAAEQACSGMFASIQGIALYDHTGEIPADAEIARPSRPPEVLLAGVSGGDPRRAVREALDRLRPSAIAICGYATPDARECLRWARRNGARAILMTETRECDAPRVWWKEWIKSRLVRRFHGGLCGGPAARAYLEKLGMPASRIEEGYDVVDNAYFAEKTQDYKTQDAREEGRRQRSDVKGQECVGSGSDLNSGRSQNGMARAKRGQSEGGVSAQVPDFSSQLSAFQFSAFTPKYFLASNRFIPRKNVSGLIEAYAAYVKSDQLSVISDQDEDTESARPWHLCLLGDGELKPDLIAKCHALGLTVKECAPWESSLTPDPCSLTSESHASHSHLTPMATSGPARQKPGGPERFWTGAQRRGPQGLTRDAARVSQSSPTVFFPGFRQLDELPRFYAHAGAFVHPAFVEPWGLVVNEAMASSLPCIVTAGTGAAEVLIRHRQTGLLCDSALPDALVCAMAEITAMPASRRHDLGHAARLHLERAAPCGYFGRSLAALLSRSS